MKRKKKTKKKSTHPLYLSQEQETFITSLLQEVGNTDPVEMVAKVPDSRCAEALADGLPLKDESSIPLLLALKARFQERNVVKAIKRALFKLKKRGVSTEAFTAEGSAPSAILKPPQRERPLCYVGPVYGLGFRTILVILHRGGKGLDIGFGIVSDEEGIQEFLFNNVSKTRAKELKEHLSEQAGPLIETSLSHAATILEEAYQRHLELRSDAPVDYLELRPWLLENAPVLDRPVIYDLLPETPDLDTILTEARLWEFFNHELMDSWLIDPGALRPFMEDMLNVHNSPIVLTEAQKSARIREIKEKCMAEIFTAEKRDLLKRRLEEMGYIFFKLGQEETAGVALAAAHGAVQEASVLKTNPVVETLFERSLGFYMKAMEEKGSEQGNDRDDASPIILP
ncbi:MAG: hypothetical protein KJ823_01995 [Proteobacteria bacterium]|nr:hypothetical protein [Pseudomonadota bacterium]